jgi:hypothetical protein
MSSLRISVRASWAKFSFVALAPLAVAVGTMPPVGSSGAATTQRLACLASQISVSAGATQGETNYSVRTPTGVQERSASKVIPVYFFNRGATCHLLMGGPSVRAVRNTTDATHLSMNDLGVPVDTGTTRRPVVSHHQKIEALFVYMKPVGPPFAGCKPSTATGLLMDGYAKPGATKHFIARRLADVCFDTGVGRDSLNYGVAWPAP